MSRVASLSRLSLANKQNLLKSSNAFDSAADWTLSLVTATPASAVNPITGSGDAYLIADNSTNNFHRLLQMAPRVTNGLLRRGVAYTASAYFKNNTRRYAGQVWDTGGLVNKLIVDLQSGSITSSVLGDTPNVATWSGLVEPVIGNSGWYRVSVTFTMKLDLTFAVQMGIGLSNDGTNFSYAGDGSSVYLYGAQFVQANYPGPYQVTTSSAITTPIRNKVVGRAAVSGRKVIS